MQDMWQPFTQGVEQRIQPVLESIGFSVTHFGFSEEKPGEHPYFQFERPQDGLRIGIDALKWSLTEDLAISGFRWIRVEIGRQLLRILYPNPLPGNFCEEQGWIYINNHQLDDCLDEIVTLLRQHFSIE